MSVNSGFRARKRCRNDELMEPLSALGDSFTIINPFIIGISLFPEPWFRGLRLLNGPVCLGVMPPARERRISAMAMPVRWALRIFPFIPC